MAISAQVGVWLAYANVFIAAFITVYAHLFLKQTKKHKDRRPWDFLFMASFLYLIFQIFNVLVVSGFTTLVSVVNLAIVGSIMAFFYSGLVLLAFISQHDLILKSQLILISKKDKKEEAEDDVQVKVSLPKRKEPTS
ncbi:MAG: hypothetical protein OXR66_01370 [Candidatus Woesearchaeota archaeon]|nr:hypothetical protein [Candidatus Woesearchaeota archaeon]